MSSLPLAKQVLGLIVCVGGSYAAAAVGAAASANAGSFYAQLVQPKWAPPAWLFGPVWGVLYTLMGVAAWLVWRRAGFAGARCPLTLFLVQLVLNALWSWFFFALRNGVLSLVDIGLLWIAILAMMLLFWRIEPLAGALLLPYVLWVTFAALLNAVLLRLNPTLLR